MVSDSELVERLREILRRSDLDTATAGSVRRQMEEDLGVDLSDKKGFIREQIDVFLQTLNGEDEKGAKEIGEEANGAVKEEEEEEEEEEESEGQKKKKKNGRKGKEVKKARGGFAKVCSLSPQLQELVGDAQLARTEVVKRLWVYIHEKELQDPKNKRIIRCDDAFRAVFRVNTIDMFKMNKALTKHIWPLDSQEDQKPTVDDDNVGNSSSEQKIGNEEEEQDRDEVSTGRGKKRKSKNKGDKAVKKKGGGGGFTKVCSLSPQLQEFIGAPEMARTQVVKKLWNYIHENNLQDPKDRRTIICDESLRSLFKVDSIGMFQMNKALSEHIRPLNEEDAPRKSSPVEEQDTEERTDGETPA